MPISSCALLLETQRCFRSRKTLIMETWCHPQQNKVRFEKQLNRVLQSTQLSDAEISYTGKAEWQYKFRLGCAVVVSTVQD